MFAVAIHIALKMAIKSDYVLQKTFTNFYKPQFQTGPPKNSKKRRKNCNILGSKTSEIDMSTLHYGLPSSFTTLSTWSTTKRV